jgi:hypothetical protein
MAPLLLVEAALRGWLPGADLRASELKTRRMSSEAAPGQQPEQRDLEPAIGSESWWRLRTQVGLDLVETLDRET